MNVFTTPLPGLLVLEPRVFRDDRGHFLESWNSETFRRATGVEVQFVQDNHSHSRRDVLRGVHYQVVRPQGKLVRVVQGAVFDVAVDLRRSSATFGQWYGTELTGDNLKQVWIPPGFGHAFLVTSESADFLYKTTDYWVQQHDRALRWNDPQIGVRWPLERDPVLADKDRNAPLLANAEVFD